MSVQETLLSHGVNLTRTSSAMTTQCYDSKHYTYIVHNATLLRHNRQNSSQSRSKLCQHKTKTVASKTQIYSFSVDLVI